MNKSEGHYFTFSYDERGYGDLILRKDGNIQTIYRSRSGSCNQLGELVNAISEGVWTIRKNPVDTIEVAMVITPGKGWKVRLWNPSGQWTHYLIHPDGGKAGTKGCIGIQNIDALELKNRIKQIRKKQKHIPVYVNVPIPIEEPSKPEEVDMPEKKPWWKSRTVWLNTLTLLGVGLQELSGTKIIPPQIIATGLTVVNLILRFLTTKPVGK